MSRLQRDKRRASETREEQIGRVLGKIGPSMMLTSVTEATAFFLGKHRPLKMGKHRPLNR